MLNNINIKMFDIITVGSGTVDIFVKVKKSDEEIKVDERSRDHHVDVAFHVGGKSLIDELYSFSGGGGTNSAVAFARLGFKTGWLGKLGDDHQRHGIEHELRREKVEVICKPAKGNTGLSIILIGLQHDRAVLTYKGVNDKLEWKDVSKGLNTKCFYFSSLMGKSFKTLERLALYAKKKGIMYAFNPSHYLACLGLNKLKKIVDGCNILVLNKEEAQDILKDCLAVDEMLKRLKKQVGIIVITDGKQGAYAYDGRDAYYVKPEIKKVVESTGAGDAFASGFVAGMIKTRNVEFAMKLGLVEAESVLKAIGAKNFLLTWKEAVKMAKRVRVERYRI